MNTIDKNYLALQFQVKLYQKYAAEFQSFFEGGIKDKDLRERIRAQ